ncbi:hypothetical protein ABD91_21450 [Lysinibacillus sphaericus]|uniref:hypothetical protein n=1 Tax=Lysinibacillus sphaericus TaxID=1421 RepID=UPI0018CF8131|nr:hypothetical protein [Lysinibacillus sphaericus]MBG9693304.1 hypothetical protein [Lysinibacillus sphaericus]
MKQKTPILVEIPGQANEKQPIKTIIVGSTAGEYEKLVESIGGKVIQINPSSENMQYINPFEIPIEITTEK